MIVENRIAGTRITVWDVLHHLEHGWSIEDIAEVFGLSTDQVRSAVDYIGAHKADIMKVHHEIEARNARGNPPEIEERLKKAREKRLEWQKQQVKVVAR